MCISLVKSSCPRSVCNLVVCNMPMEVKIIEPAMFMFRGDLTFLRTCSDITVTLLASLGLFIYMAAS